MKNLAIIPARGGSKRIPKKNIRNFCGKPIISYSIEAALSSGFFSEVMVSTDDIDIANIAKQIGAEVPFFRSQKNSDDYSGIVEVLLEVVNEYQKLGMNFDNICCILPTAPLIQSEKLKEGLDKLIINECDSVLSASTFSYPIQRCLQIDKSDKISMVWPENYSARSQDLPQRYHDAGQFYWVTQKYLLKEEKIFSLDTNAILLSELCVQDIDTEEDWKLCELKYKLQQKVK